MIAKVLAALNSQTSLAATRSLARLLAGYIAESAQQVSDQNFIGARFRVSAG